MVSEGMGNHLYSSRTGTDIGATEMDHQPLLTEALWADLARRRKRREVISKWLVLLVLPCLLGLAIHLAW